MTPPEDDAGSPRSRPGRRALFSGPYDPGLAAGSNGEAREDLGAGSGPQHKRGARPAPGRRKGGGLPGRRALFSDAGAGTAAEQDAGSEVRPGPTTAVVECRTCLARTPMSLVGLTMALVPSLWLPGRPWPRLLRCPACHRVSWCRIEWPSLRSAES